LTKPVLRQQPAVAPPAGEDTVRVAYTITELIR